MARWWIARTLPAASGGPGSRCSRWKPPNVLSVARRFQLAQLVARLLEFGGNLEGRLKFPHRSWFVVLRFQDQAQLIMRLGGTRVRGERGAKMPGSLRGL